jgi:hypothetical protein
MSATRKDVIAVCIERAGWREGRKMAQFIFEWEVATRSIGRQISPDEFAEWWRENRATTYRHLARFRAAFPELGDHGKPGDLMTVRPAAAKLPALGALVA